MPRTIVQVRPQPWPSGNGQATAIVGVSLEALATQHSFRLYEGTDNLGDYRAVAITLPSGRQIGLLRHDGTTPDETEIHADVQDDPQDVIRELLGGPGLSRSVLRWVRKAVV